MEKIEEIRKIATDVRKAVEVLKSSGQINPSEIPFGRFPKACCGDMSIILATHYQNYGFELADYICGEHFENGNSHAWIRLDGICIDITADQFEFAQFSPVIVEYEENYPLKEIFLVDRPPSKYQIDKDHLRAMYRKIKEQLALQ